MHNSTDNNIHNIPGNHFLPATRQIYMFKIVVNLFPNAFRESSKNLKVKSNALQYQDAWAIKDGFIKEIEICGINIKGFVFDFENNDRLY